MNRCYEVMTYSLLFDCCNLTFQCITAIDYRYDSWIMITVYVLMKKIISITRSKLHRKCSSFLCLSFVVLCQLMTSSSNTHLPFWWWFGKYHSVLNFYGLLACYINWLCVKLLVEFYTKYHFNLGFIFVICQAEHLFSISSKKLRI